MPVSIVIVSEDRGEEFVPESFAILGEAVAFGLRLADRLGRSDKRANRPTRVEIRRDGLSSFAIAVLPGGLLNGAGNPG